MPSSASTSPRFRAAVRNAGSLPGLEPQYTATRRNGELTRSAIGRGYRRCRTAPSADSDRYRVGVSAQPVGDPGDDPLGARLLEAATAVFAERGYAGAHVADIAARAGVTTGAIYSRYEGKAELLAEAIEQATGNEFDALFSDHRFEGRMEDILRIAGSHLVERSEGQERSKAPGMLLESFTAARHEPDVAAMLRARMGARHERLAAIVEAAKETGGIDREVDTEALV